MDSKDLITFLYLAKTKNFSKTAELLYVTQSTVSARIKALENEIGNELFIRNNKSVELTEAGKSFKPYAIKVYKLMEEGRYSLKNSSKFESFITLSATNTIWSYTPLLQYINDYMTKNPMIALKLFCSHSEDIIQGIIDNAIDVGFSYIKPYYPEVVSIPYCDYKFCLLGSPSLLLPHREVTPETLIEFPFIYMDWGAFFNSWFEKYYPLRTYFLEVDSERLFLDFLLNDKGIGFAPELMAKRFLDNNRLVKIDHTYKDDTPLSQAYIIFLKRNSNLIEGFISEFLAYSDMSAYDQS